MRIEGEGKLVRIFIGESAKHGHKPLYQAIVEMLREKGYAGATVIRGAEGFGASSRLHTNRLLALSQDLPVVIECIDTSERIDDLLPLLDGLVEKGLVTVQPVDIVTYRAGGGPRRA